MRIAVFSDVHANLPALEAVYLHISEQHVDAMYCLGDLVNQNVWNNEVVEFISSKQIPCVLGNHDEGIGNNQSRYPFNYGSWEEIEWGLEAISFTINQVTDKNKKTLRSFPIKRYIDLKTKEEHFRITLAHGSPSNNKERLYYYYTEEQLLQIFNTEKTQLLFTGNTHCTSHRIISKMETGKPAYFHVINPGSVGCPKDGTWHATYAIVTIDTTKEILRTPQAVSVNFFRLDYDIDKVIRSIKNSPLSMYYAGRFLK